MSHKIRHDPDQPAANGLGSQLAPLAVDADSATALRWLKTTLAVVIEDSRQSSAGVEAFRQTLGAKHLGQLNHDDILDQPFAHIGIDAAHEPQMLRPYRLDPRELAIECEVLLAHVLGVSRAALHAHPERRLDDLERAELEALVSRRLAREPVAYLVGRREFFGLEVLVDRRVLIPRPETEHLVERAIAEVGRLGRQDVRIADVGTGSGAIAVALAKHLPQAKLYAIDLSAAALDVAATNCRRLGVAGRVTLLHGDLLAPLPEAVDVIVANLPYVAPEEMAGLAPEVTRFEPRRALIADDGGMLYYNRLLDQAKAYLRPAGVIVCEIAPHQAVPLLARIGEALPGATTGIDNDLAGHDRVLWLRLPAQTVHYAGSSRSSLSRHDDSVGGTGGRPGCNAKRMTFGGLRSLRAARIRPFLYGKRATAGSPCECQTLAGLR